jgi:hypothetical protein
MIHPRHRKRRWTAVAASVPLVAVVMIATGCVPRAQGPLPALSVSDRYGNAPVLAAFVKRACVDTTDYPNRYAQMLDQTGWKHRQVANGREEGELDMWQLPHVQLVHAQTPVSKGEVRVWTCQVAIDGQVAPQINRMETALRRDVGNRQVFASQPGDWHWKPSVFTEAHLTLDRGRARDSLTIMVEYAALEPVRAMLGRKMP